MASNSRSHTSSVSNLIELLASRAAAEPKTTAYTFLKDESNELSITYQGLNRRAQAVAAWLAGRISPGDRVLLLYPPGIDFLAGFFGCLYAGAIAAPLPLPSARQGMEKLGLVVRDTGAAAALTVSSLAQDRMAAGPLAAHLAIQATDEIPEESADEFRPRESVTDPAYLQYTSGSTSTPRGVMVTHSNVLHNLANIDAGFRHTEASVAVTWLPHFHDMGLIYGLLGPLYVGMPCYFFSPAAFVQRPRTWLEAITRYKATHSGGPNFAYDLCVRRISEEDRAGLDLSSWEVAFNGAEPVHAETLERFTRAFAPYGFRNEAHHPAYGLAEASLKVSGGVKGQGPRVFRAKASALAQNRVELAAPGSSDARTLVGCGRPGLDTRVAIVDPETREECPPGVVGEIWVRGPGVAKGYWRRPEETAETFEARITGTGEGPFLRTGDLGFLRDGELFVAGRRKDLIIIRGMNHHPADLELTARKAHPMVATSVGAAFSVEAGGDERLVLVMEAPRREPGDPEAVARSVRQRIAEKHEVRVYSFVLVRKGGVPKTSSGKIQRSLCRSMYLQGDLPVLHESRMEEARIDDVAPGLDRETALAAAPAERAALIAGYLRALLARTLQARPEDFEDARPLAAYGLDSLLAMELQNSVESDLGVSVTAVELLAGSTLESLSDAVLRGFESDIRTVEPIPARGEIEAPLSFEQERLWLLNQLAPGNAAYHIPFAFRVRGRLDLKAFERAVAAVAERQESLRTVFAERKGQQRCVTLPASEPPVEVDDLRACPESEREETALERIARTIREPFDLSRGPLFRLRLYRLAEEDYIALVVMHHIVSDVWSLRIFLEETFEAYQELVTGDDAQVEALPVQYGDFAAWQRQRLQDQRLERLVDFWSDKLEGAPRLKMPLDRPRPATPSFQGAGEAIPFPRELTESVKEYCRQRGVTLFTVLMAAFEALAARLSGQTDIVIGTTNANRHRPELERLIGFFAAPLVVRVQLGGDPEFGEIVERVQRTLLEAYEHQELPFAKVVEAAHPGRQSSYTPLFQVMFSVVRSMLPARELPDLELEAIELNTVATDFDLFVNIVEEPKDLEALAVFNKDVYNASTVRALMAAYLDVLAAATRSPDRKLSELPVPLDLVRRPEEEPVEGEKLSLAVAATFTSEPVEEILNFWLNELGFQYRVRFAPYNQVFQQLLDPSSQVGRNKDGANVILVRLQDWAGTGFDTNQLEENVRNFAEALQTASARLPCPFLVCFCPNSPEFLADSARAELADRMEKTIAGSFAGGARVHVATSAEIARLYPVAEYHDSHGERLGHVPYTPEFFAALGTVIARKIHALRTAPFKVAALDCDQTLWKGVCGEDGPYGVRLDEPRRALQEFMLDQRRAGMLLTIASKNNEEDVWAVFEAHPEMPLKKEHFVAWRINWEPKSGSLRQIARDLDLGLDSFVFVDDSPTECAEVRAAAPETLTLELPRESSLIPQYLQHVWAFDRLAVTEEDRARAEMYGQRLERRKLQRKTATLSEFLEELGLRVEIAPLTPARIPRVSQLTQRTNQFNLTTIRRSEAEIQEFLKNGECLTVNVTDRFGSYGLVGVALFRASEEAVEVDTFLLSCRALGRGVEHKMLARLGKLALDRGLPEVRLPYRKTPKNRPGLQFLESVGAAEASGLRSRFGADRVYVLSARQAAGIRYNPATEPGEPIPESSVAAPQVEASTRSIDYERIARELNSAKAILNAVRAAGRSDAVSTVPYEAPRTPLEKRLAAIWSEMLNVPVVGVNDNFFDLGGHSLLAVQLLSRVREEFNVDLSLDVVFSGVFSVAELAKAIELYEIQQAGGEEYEALLAELEGLSDEEVRALLEQEGGGEAG